MRNLLYGIATLLMVAWGIGFIGYTAGGLIHVLPVLAITAIIFGLTRTRT
jgi:hypothetical protein